MMDWQQREVEVNGIRMCYFERGDTGAAKTVLMVHATGFHARCWDQTAALLGDVHIISIDQRGHGRSDDAPPFTWTTFGEDLIAFVEALDLHHMVGVGHSMGGHVLVQACAAMPGRFDALVLVDPVILPPPAYDAYEPMDPSSHPVSRRRSRFENPAALIGQLQGRGGYAFFTTAALDDYCRFGLIEEADGGYRLACPPEVEAAIYTGSAGAPVFDQVRSIECPVTLLRAAPRDEGSTGMDFSRSPTWPELASLFQDVEDVFHPELSHFIPMQAPQLVADHVRALMENTL